MLTDHSAWTEQNRTRDVSHFYSEQNSVFPRPQCEQTPLERKKLLSPLSHMHLKRWADFSWCHTHTHTYNMLIMFHSQSPSRTEARMKDVHSLGGLLLRQLHTNAKMLWFKKNQKSIKRSQHPCRGGGQESAPPRMLFHSHTVWTLRLTPPNTQPYI